jgi:hypothetical protein
MRIDMTSLKVLLLATCVAVRGVAAQTAADGPLLGAHRLLPTAALKMWHPAGRVRLIAWDRDSVVVRGRVARKEHFFFGGDTTAFKLGIEGRQASATDKGSDVVVYLPRRCKVSV